MELLIDLVINALAIFVGAKLLSGIELKDFMQAIIVCIIVALLNITLGTILKIVTLGLLTVGIFTFLLDAILFQIADAFLPNFKIKSFWWALGLAIIVSITNGLFQAIL